MLSLSEPGPNHTGPHSPPAHTSVSPQSLHRCISDDLCCSHDPSCASAASGKDCHPCNSSGNSPKATTADLADSAAAADTLDAASVFELGPVPLSVGHIDKTLLLLAQPESAGSPHSANANGIATIAAAAKHPTAAATHAVPASSSLSNPLLHAASTQNDAQLTGASDPLSHTSAAAPVAPPVEPLLGTALSVVQDHFFCMSPDSVSNPTYYWLGPRAGDNFLIDQAVGPFKLDLGDVLYAPNTLQDAQVRIGYADITASWIPISWRRFRPRRLIHVPRFLWGVCCTHSPTYRPQRPEIMVVIVGLAPSPGA